jgi:REP element-mobilizing transposase RayT
MPRKLRVEYPGAFYHKMTRANGKGVIFEFDVDRQDFLKTLAKMCDKTGFQARAFCLMLNHFNLVVETPSANLVAGLRWLLSAWQWPTVKARNHPDLASDTTTAASGDLEKYHGKLYRWRKNKTGGK